MSRRTATICKFVGVATLGLLTGTSLSLSQLAIPPLLALPSPAPAQRAFVRLRERTAVRQRFLSATALVSLLSAFILSPRHQRHPYLLWTALPVLSVLGFDWWHARAVAAAHSPAGARNPSGSASRGVKDSTTTSAVRDRSVSSEEDDHVVIGGEDSPSGSEDEAVNGEKVQVQMERWGQSMAARGAAWALSWTLVTIGIWGEGA